MNKSSFGITIWFQKKKNELLETNLVEPIHFKQTNVSSFHCLAHYPFPRDQTRKNSKFLNIHLPSPRIRFASFSCVEKQCWIVNLKCMPLLGLKFLQTDSCINVFKTFFINFIFCFQFFQFLFLTLILKLYYLVYYNSITIFNQFSPRTLNQSIVSTYM